MNCKNCVRHFGTVPVCQLPDGTQGEATEFKNELDCEYHLDILEYLKLNENRGIYLEKRCISLLLEAFREKNIKK
jgi:hypothetical protein